MRNDKHLYLFTLEVVPLSVGTVYNPLPSHLTLVCRYWSTLSPQAIAESVAPIFQQTQALELIFSEAAKIGPKHTDVHLVEHDEDIRQLHERLCSSLDAVGVEYTLPQFIRNGFKPHVSQREGDGFLPGHIQMIDAAYLIEVEIRGDQHLRFVRSKFDLQS